MLNRSEREGSLPLGLCCALRGADSAVAVWEDPYVLKGRIRGIYLRGEIYWFGKQVNGRRSIVSLETRDYVEAVERALVPFALWFFCQGICEHLILCQTTLLNAFFPRQFDLRFPVGFGHLHDAF